MLITSIKEYIQFNANKNKKIYVEDANLSFVKCEKEDIESAQKLIDELKKVEASKEKLVESIDRDIEKMVRILTIASVINIILAITFNIGGTYIREINQIIILAQFIIFFMAALLCITVKFNLLTIMVEKNALKKLPGSPTAKAIKFFTNLAKEQLKLQEFLNKYNNDDWKRLCTDLTLKKEKLTLDFVLKGHEGIKHEKLDVKLACTMVVEKEDVITLDAKTMTLMIPLEFYEKKR